MDETKAEAPAESGDISSAPTQMLRREDLQVDTDSREAKFQEEQSQILKMISANAPLSEILTKLVLLIEEQSPGMLCSVLLLSADGNHIEHGAAPSLAPIPAQVPPREVAWRLSCDPSLSSRHWRAWAFPLPPCPRAA